MQTSSTYLMPPISAAAVISQAAGDCLRQRLLSIQRNGYTDEPSSVHGSCASPTNSTPQNFDVPSNHSTNFADLSVSAMAAAMMVAKGLNAPEASALHIPNQQHQQLSRYHEPPPLLSVQVLNNQLHHKAPFSDFDENSTSIISSMETAELEGLQAASETISQMNVGVIF